MATTRIRRLPRAALLALLLLPGVALAQTPAAPPAPPPGAGPMATSTVELDIVEGGAQNRSTVRFTLAVAQGQTGELKVDAGRASYEVRISVEPRGQQMRLDVELKRFGDAAAGGFALRQTATVTPGKHTVLATAERADGGTVQVAATVR